MKKNTLKKELDWVSMLVPLAIVLTVCALFMIFPEGSKLVLSVVRGFLGDDFGLYYALLGVGIVGCTLYIAFSKFGKIKLGDCEKPQYRSFQWGTMIFTSTMAADILFYSLCEWALYANESQVEMMGGMQKWASTYPLFHWGPIAWGFYIVLAVAFGFMIHIRGREKQKFSEACRPPAGKPGRWSFGACDRPDCDFCADCGHSDDVFSRNAAAFQSNQPCVWPAGQHRVNDSNPFDDRGSLHLHGLVRHERNREARRHLQLLLFCTACIRSVWRR